MTVWLSGRSRELEPTPMAKSPASTAQRPCRTDQNENARWSSSIDTRRDSPAARLTLVNPLSSRTGRATVDSVSCDVDLHHLGTLDGAGVGDGHAHGRRQGVVNDGTVSVYRQVGQREGGVGQPEAERERHVLLGLVVAAVADEQALAVPDDLGVAGEVEVGRVVLQPVREWSRPADRRG